MPSAKRVPPGKLSTEELRLLARLFDTHGSIRIEVKRRDSSRKCRYLRVRLFICSKKTEEIVFLEEVRRRIKAGGIRKRSRNYNTWCLDLTGWAAYDLATLIMPYVSNKRKIERMKKILEAYSLIAGYDGSYPYSELVARLYRLVRPTRIDAFAATLSKMHKRSILICMRKARMLELDEETLYHLISIIDKGRKKINWALHSGVPTPL